MSWININDIVYPIGHVVTTTSNISPAETLGGTWTLIDKRFSDLGDAVSSTVGSGASSFTVAAMRAGNTIRFRVAFVPNTTIADTTLTMGVIDFESAGITGLGYGVYNYPAGADAPGGFAMCQVGYDSGTVTTVDAVGKTSGELASGSTYYLDFTAVVYHTRMLDSACKEWLWKRTA